MLGVYKRNFASFLFKNSWFLFSLGLLLFVMYPCFIYGDFLFHDDLGSLRGGCPFTPWLSILGRPLGDKIACLQFTLLNSSTAAITRDLTIVVLIMVQLAVYKFLRRENFSKHLSIFMAFGVSVLPGMMVYTSWLTAAYIIFSLPFAAFSALLCQQILKKNIQKSIVTYLLFFMAVVTELASDLIHQNGGMFFLVFFVVAFAQVFYRNSSSLLRAVFVYGIGFMPANLIYFIYFKIRIAAVLAPQDPTRGVLFHDLMGRFAWFFHNTLPRALNLWFNIFSTGWSVVSIIVCAVFMASLIFFVFSFFRHKKSQHAIGKTVFYILSLLLVMLGCYLPSLVANMYLDFFRALVPLSAFFFLMICAHLSIAFPKQEIKVQKVLISLMILIAFFANQAMLNHMVMPKYLEFQYLKNVVRQIKVEQLDNIPVHIIRTSMLPETSGLNTDEIGCINTTFRGHGVVLIEDMRRQLNLPKVSITDSRPGEYFDPKGKIVIDFSTLSFKNLRGDLERLPLKIRVNPL